MVTGISHKNTVMEEINFDDASSLINLTRDKRAAIAEDTLEKLNAGWYCPSRGPRINFKEDVSFCVNNSILYTEGDLRNRRRLTLPVDDRDVTPMTSATSSYPKIEVRHCTTLQAAQYLVVEMGEEHVGVLNFASARNPGGGFLKGASAQEESLARNSSLYFALSQERFFTEFYGYHRRIKNGIYSHRMIYSPRVTIFKDDNGKLLSSPYHVGIVTAPAPNAGIVQDQQAIRNAMTERIKRVLYAFEVNKHDTLVLGAFGCGVFKNNPLEVATIFRRFLESDEFKNSFKRIIFAILNPEMCHLFEQVFAANDVNHIPQQTIDICDPDRDSQAYKKSTRSGRNENNGRKQAHLKKYRNYQYYENDDQ